MNTATNGVEKVWILEMNSNPLKGEAIKTNDGKKTHKFRGLCAEFTDDLNENNRLYDRPNYDQKANDLQDKIGKRALLGELDHNEDFLVSMKNASHIITGLKGLKNEYQIEIELVPGTVQGNNAIALAEAGVPLFISSRASGYIDRAGNVTLEKIYTYDLVSEPGFKNAELIKVNESLRPDGKIRQYKNSNIRIYKWTDPEHKGNTENNLAGINKQNKQHMSYATKSDLLELRKEIASLKKNGVRAINESLQVPSKLRYNGIPVEMLSKVPQKNDVLTIDSTEFVVKKVENIDESLDNSPNFKLRGTYAYTLGLEDSEGITKIGYITKTGEFHVSNEVISPNIVKESFAIDKKIKKVFEAIEAKMNDLIEESNNTKLERKAMIKYLDGLVKFVEMNLNKHDQMVKFVNLLADHSDNSTKVLNKLLESSDDSVKLLNSVAESLDATQQFINEHADHSDAQTIVLNKLIEHSEKATKHLNMLHKHSDQLTTTVNVHEARIARGGRTTPVSAKVNESTGKSKPVISLKKENVLELTKNILAKVNSNKTEETRLVLEAKYPFIKQFNEKELSDFKALTSYQKQHVLGKLGSNARKANVLEAIRFASQQSDELAFLDLMPNEKKQEWAKLPTQRKQNIIALFQSKHLRTKTAIEAFWDDIDLKPVKTTGLVRRIDESIENPLLQKTAMGYSIDDMDEALGI